MVAMERSRASKRREAAVGMGGPSWGGCQHHVAHGCVLLGCIVGQDIQWLEIGKEDNLNST